MSQLLLKLVQGPAISDAVNNCLRFMRRRETILGGSKGISKAAVVACCTSREDLE